MENNLIIWYDGTNNHEDCVVFQKSKESFGGLSNMAGGYPLRINGQVIYSSESLYQACRFPYHSDWQQEIISFSMKFFLISRSL